MTCKLYTDGGARGNPGPAAIGAVILNEEGEKIFELSSYLGNATNNQAEYAGIIEGLKAAQNRNIKKITCFMDSELVVKQLKGQYKVKNPELKNLWKEAATLASKFEQIEFIHIPREKNADADLLVNQALDKRMFSKKD